jgi:hypothetical protein
MKTQQQWEVWSIPNNSLAPATSAPCLVALTREALPQKIWYNQEDLLTKRGGYRYPGSFLAGSEQSKG